MQTYPSKHFRHMIFRVLIFVFIFEFYFSLPLLFSACEVNCSDLADDETAFTRIAENINAIETEMNQIREWQSDPLTNLNAIILSANRKAQNANNVREILNDYFLYQKIQPLAAKDADYMAYTRKLGLCHELLNAAAWAKDTNEAAAIDHLRTQLDAFKNAYYGQGPFQLGQQLTQNSVITVTTSETS